VVEVPYLAQKSNNRFPDDVKAKEGSFQVEKLPYAYDARSYSIAVNFRDALFKTLTYTNNLNDELNMKTNRLKIFYLN
jgi:Fe-Mn family superoxide dismutase